jgi:hypothetical protein
MVAGLEEISEGTISIGDARQLLVVHPLRNGVPPRAWTNRARAERHRVFGSTLLARAQGRAAEKTEDDSFAVRDDADLPVVADAFGDGGDEFVGPAHRGVATGERADARPAVGVSVERQPERSPVGLAGDVVVDAGETESFEPRRGSWAQVSLGVVEVDDHRAQRIERLRRFAGERPQRNVDRARQVLVANSSAGSTSTN